MFEEDPLNRWCRTIVEMCFLLTMLAELLIRQIGRQFTYHCQILILLGRHVLFVLWVRAKFQCSTLYQQYICVPLMLCGLMKVPTWTDIEEYRLQLIAKSGHDLPRPAILEDGLRQEQMEQAS